MTITIGGAPGPRTGMTQMGARAVQAPEPAVKKAETAPAPVKPEMTLPDPKLKPRQQPKNAPKEAAAKTLSTGAEPQEGTAKAETRVRGQGFGLSSGGGGGAGGVTVDAVNFCCPDYILTMSGVGGAELERESGTYGTDHHEVHHLEGRCDRRDSGRETKRVSAARRRGGEGAASRTSCRRCRARYPNPTLTVHLEFAYER